MAVPGRKQITQQRSLEAGSAEDVHFSCEPCLTISELREAYGFCVSCQEYLCKNCCDCHKRAKISRNHQILENDELDKLNTFKKSCNECTEHCTIHQNEVVKFYCSKYDLLGCNDCMTIGHRACEIEYIPDKCTDVVNGEIFNDVLEKLSGKLNAAETVSANATNIITDITDKYEDIEKAINGFRKEINNHLDQMQQDLLIYAKGKRSDNNKIVQSVIDSCGTITSDIKKLKSSLYANKSKHQNGQLYIDIKRAESSMKSVELNEMEQTLKNTNMNYSFHRNANIKNLLSQKNVFGELVSHPHRVSAKMSVDHLTRKEDINVKTETDEKECLITGNALLPSNNLILADKNNWKLKVVSLKTRRIVEEKCLDIKPWDIAVMSRDEVAMTLPHVREIVVMGNSRKTLNCS